MVNTTKESQVISIDDARDTLDRVIAFINNCDNKASIMLGILGVILTIVFTGSGMYTQNSILDSITSNSTIGGVVVKHYCNATV